MALFGSFIEPLNATSVWTCTCITVLILHFSSCPSRYDSNMHNDSNFIYVAIVWPTCTSFLFLRLFNKPLISSAMQCPGPRCTKHHHQQRLIISRPGHRPSKFVQEIDGTATCNSIYDEKLVQSCECSQCHRSVCFRLFNIGDEWALICVAAFATIRICILIINSNYIVKRQNWQ